MSPREVAMAARVERLERRVQDLESKLNRALADQTVERAVAVALGQMGAVTAYYGVNTDAA